MAKKAQVAQGRILLPSTHIKSSSIPTNQNNEKKQQ